MIDVAIVGGGPAGASAAYALARRGARVALFDPSHPREKPCGGGITGRALELVADALAGHRWPARAIQRARFVEPHHDDGPAVALEAGALVVASRAEFDAALLATAESAGATIVRDRVRDVRVERHGVAIETLAARHTAAAVIGADGANSLVRRRVAMPFRRDQLSVATGFFAHGASGDEILIELATDPPGYFWSFPRPDHLAIGVCAQASDGVGAQTLRDRTTAWIARTRLAERASLTAYSWPIPSLSARDLGALAPAGPRWCLVGDAAGLVDPITREGIYFAIASGQWAADALAAHAGERRYAERVHDEAVAELARAARLKAGFFRPAFSALTLRALRHSERVRRVMADLVAGRQSYRSLKWRLLKTFEFGLAWQTISGRSSRLAP